MAFDRTVGMSMLMPLAQKLIEVDNLSRSALEAAEIMISEEAIPRGNPIRVPVAVLALSMAVHRRRKRAGPGVDQAHADAWQNLYAKLCQMANQADFSQPLAQGQVQRMTGSTVQQIIIREIYALTHQLMRSEGFRGALHRMAEGMGKSANVRRERPSRPAALTDHRG